MCSNSSSLSRSPKILLVEDFSSGLSVRMLAVLSKILKIQSEWLTYSELFIVIYPFSFLTSFSKKLIKIPLVSLSGLSSFLSCIKTEYDALLSVNLWVHQVISLINYIVSSIPSENLYLYWILLTSQNTMHLVYSSSISADISLSTMLTRKIKACLITVFDWYAGLNTP